MQVNLENKEAETNYGIKLPNNSWVSCPISYKFIPITIGGIVFPRVLIQFDSSDFDIILEISWLGTYEAKIDCENLKAISRYEQGRENCLMEKCKNTLSFKFCYESKWALCAGYWYYAIHTQL